MTIPRVCLALPGWVLASMMLASPAQAECGGSQQCIAVSIDPAVAPAHGTPLTSATLAFGIQQVNTSSAARTILVGAVTGPTGTSATLDSITLTGADAGDFRLAGGTTCTTGTPTLLHEGPSCNIEITFEPASTGNKSARLEVATAVITRTIPLAGIGTLTGLPAPSGDPTVRAVVRSHVETARRFAGSQLANFRQRLESLHVQRARVPAPGPATPLHADADDTRVTPAQRAPTTALAHMARQLGASGEIDLWHLNALGPNASPRAGATGLWIAGNVGVGERDQSSDSDSLRFSTDGVSTGVDRWFGEQLLLGAGIGWAQNETEIGDERTRDGATATALSVYGSYRPAPSTYIDALIGYTELRYDTDRYIPATDQFARSRRRGEQWFGSLGAGYLYRRDELLLSPYGRVDFSLTRLDEESESGAGNLDLTYFEQDVDAGQLSLGLRAEAPHATSFGWALPRLRLEWQHDFAEDRAAEVAFANSAQRFALRAGGDARDSLLLGVGSDFVYRNGLTLGIEYQGTYSSDAEESEMLGLWLAKDLDGKPSLGQGSAALFEAPIQVDAGYGAEDNINRVRDDAEQIADESVGVSVKQSAAYATSARTRVVVTASLGLEQLREHAGLDRASATVQSEFQYRTSSRFAAPTFGVYARAGLDEYESRLRSGARYALGVNLRKQFTDRIGFFGAVEHNLRDAENDVFDTADNAARFTLDYALGRRGVLFFGGEFRDGDTVSSTPPTAFYTSIADATAEDDAYRNLDLTAARYEAETVLWTLGYNHSLGPRDSIDFTWRRASSEPKDVPAGTPDAGDNDYTADRYSLHYLMRF